MNNLISNRLRNIAQMLNDIFHTFVIPICQAFLRFGPRPFKIFSQISLSLNFLSLCLCFSFKRMRYLKEMRKETILLISWTVAIFNTRKWKGSDLCTSWIWCSVCGWTLIENCCIYNAIVPFSKCVEAHPDRVPHLPDTYRLQHTRVSELCENHVRL